MFCFTAPWNIVYKPKILDPFTGHEAKGDLVSEYTAIFKTKGFKLFEPLIEDFNNLMIETSFQDKIDQYLFKLTDDVLISSAQANDFTKAVKEELSIITVE